MLKLTKEHRQPRKAAKPKQPPPPPIVAPRQPVIRRQMGMEVLDQEGGVSQEIPRPFYPGFLSALPGLQQNNDLKKELVPIYKILEESVRVSLCPSFKHTPPTHACLLFLFLLSSTWKLLNLSFVYYSLPVRSLCCVFRLYLSPCFSPLVSLLWWSSVSHHVCSLFLPLSCWHGSHVKSSIGYVYCHQGCFWYKPPGTNILHYGIHICEIRHEYFLLSLKEGFLLALVEFEEGLYAWMGRRN